MSPPLIEPAVHRAAKNDCFRPATDVTGSGVTLAAADTPARALEGAMSIDSVAPRCRWVRMRASWFVAVPAVVTLGACGAASPGPGQGQAGVTLTALAALAKSSAAFDGDPNVTSAEAVLTTEDGASAVMGGLDNPTERVYLVQTKGDFTANGASIPQTATKVPTGSYDILEVDASTGQVLGSGVSSADANLSSMGSVITLQL